MPKNLASTGQAFPTQTAPLAGEPRTSGSVETPLQNAADRTAYLKDRLDHLDPLKEGVRRLRSVASIAALQAVTDRPDGTIIEVAGVGLYHFDGASILAEFAPLVVKPTAIVHPDPGRWLVLAPGYGMLDVANGIPTLDGSGKLATSKLAATGGGSKILGPSIAFGLVDFATTSTSTYLSGQSTTSGTYTDVAQSDVTLTLAVGDRVAILGQAFQYQQDLDGRGHLTRWVVVKPDTSVVAIASSVQRHMNVNANEETSVAIGVYYTADAAGAHTFKMQHAVQAPNGCTQSVENLNVIALQFRP